MTWDDNGHEWPVVPCCGESVDMLIAYPVARIYLSVKEHRERHELARTRRRIRDYIHCGIGRARVLVTR